MSEPLLPPARHERRDVGFRFIVLLFGGIVITLLLMMVLAYVIYPRAMRDNRFQQPFPDFPAPRLQEKPRADMRDFYAREMRQLNSAGWINKSTGQVHIPIQQAMHDIAHRGIPGWPDAASAGATP